MLVPQYLWPYAIYMKSIRTVCLASLSLSLSLALSNFVSIFSCYTLYRYTRWFKCNCWLHPMYFTRNSMLFIVEYGIRFSHCVWYNAWLHTTRVNETWNSDSSNNEIKQKREHFPRSKFKWEFEQWQSNVRKSNRIDMAMAIPCSFLYLIFSHSLSSGQKCTHSHINLHTEWKRLCL